MYFGATCDNYVAPLKVLSSKFSWIIVNEHNSLRSFSSLRHIHFDVNWKENVKMKIIFAPKWRMTRHIHWRSFTYFFIKRRFTTSNNVKIILILTVEYFIFFFFFPYEYDKYKSKIALLFIIIFQDLRITAQFYHSKNNFYRRISKLCNQIRFLQLLTKILHWIKCNEYRHQ